MKIIFNYFGLLAILFFSECTSREKPDLVIKNIHFNNLKSFVMKKEDLIGIKIIRTYPNEETCIPKIVNANLYMCTDIRKGDTIYIFNICDKIPWFVKEIPDENFFLLGEHALIHHPDSVNILVPKSFKIPKNSNYIFSSITRLED